MLRDVDLVSYLPPFLQEYKEINATLTAENPEFSLIWSAKEQILYNCFIATADANGIARYEKILGIYPSPEDTLESRRSRVQVQWTNLIPYTLRSLIGKLKLLCGENSFALNYDFEHGYTLTVITHLENYGQVEELQRLLAEILPCNIVVDSQNTFSCIVRSEPLFGGRITTHVSITLTHDFKETYPISANHAYVGIISDTDKITISHDFKESWSIEGNAKVASGAAQCDFIEIK